jgi:6-pyruvoyltetrahydropterin/6-carboxytetrahydropterin synthase
MIDRLLYTAAVPFESARSVSVFPEGHRARRMHGHSFIAKLRAHVPSGWASFPGAEVDDLREELVRAVSPLDFQCLNDIVDEPTDENLARWLRRSIQLPAVEQIGIQSTSHSGVDLDPHDHSHIWRRFLLQSAHRLPNVPPGHKCGRLHGHGFEILLHANQNLGAKALGIDYDMIDKLWEPIHSQLDHTCLNEIPGLSNPTSEVIAAWLWNRLKPELPTLSWVTVYETAQCGANFNGSQYRIWKEMTLDSSLVMKAALPGDRRGRIHGHTYTLRLHLSAPLNEVLGWTVDFGDVKELFNPIFRLIDHQPLHELKNLEQADTASLARWIRNQVEALLPQADRIDLYETRGCGAILSWGETDIALPV